MSNKLEEYRKGTNPIADSNKMLPLFGAGFDRLGCEGGTLLETPIPNYGPDELLVRHDACGLCFSDTKIIRLGSDHPRIFRDISQEPVIMGHEVIMTVIGVGVNLKDQYRVGDRFIIQAEIWAEGVNQAYGYMIQGGLSLYNVIDKRVLDGDAGNYLIPVALETGYSEAALTEPWACVVATYQLNYRDQIKPGGRLWIIGDGTGEPRGVTISAGFDHGSHPGTVVASNIPSDLDRWLQKACEEYDIQYISAPDISHLPIEQADDIVLLISDPDLLEAASLRLANFGILAVLSDKPVPRQVNLDIGRIHYDDLLFIAGPYQDIAMAYQAVPVRSNLKPDGLAWFVGGGGPMGRMHIQRAIDQTDGPKTIVCTDLSDERLQDLLETFRQDAQAKGVDLICVNPAHTEAYHGCMKPFFEQGFDDIIALAPVSDAIGEAAKVLGQNGVLNIFAGVPRGTTMKVDLTGIARKNWRIIGHSASTIQDLRLTLEQAETGQLSPNRSVAAVGSLSAAREGLLAVRDTLFPGKVVIYPQIHEFPLTSLSDIKDKLPSVYARLRNGREWTNEAEDEFLQLMLPG